MNRTAGSRRRRRFGAGSTATRDNPEARTSSSRHCPPFTFRSSKTRRCAQLSLCDRCRVPGGAGVSGRVAETAVGDAASGDERGAVNCDVNCDRSPTVFVYTPPGLDINSSSGVYKDPSATLDDLREAVVMMEEIKPTMRRVLGGAHPLTLTLETILQNARAARDARETPPGSA